MRVSDGPVHAARLRRPGYDVLHREHHVRRVPRARVRAAAAAEAHGARRIPGSKVWPRLLFVRVELPTSCFLLLTSYFLGVFDGRGWRTVYFSVRNSALRLASGGAPMNCRNESRTGTSVLQ